MGGVGAELAAEGSAMPPEGGSVAAPGGCVANDGAACDGVMIAAGLAAGTARLWPEGTSDLTTPSICPHSPTPSADCGAAEAWQTRNGRLAATF